MTRPLAVYLVSIALVGAASILFGIGWWIPAVLAGAGAVTAIVLARRAQVNALADDVIAGLPADDPPHAG